MSVESFIRAIPKVELHIQLEGAMLKETLMVIAEQNDIIESLKHFNQWAALLDRPDYKRLDDIIRTGSKWLLQPDDLTRLVYEMGVGLAKQNVRYAEVSVNPTLYMDGGLTFEQFLSAINDGRDRAARGWGIELAWVLVVPRDQPRRADDYLRWATGTAARRGGVVGIGLGGPENAQPAAQFERPFRSAAKKGVPRVAYAGEMLGAAGILDVLTYVQPSRIIHGWGALESPDIVRLLDEQQIPLCVTMTRALRLEQIQSYADYPLRQLLDEGLLVALSAGMPELDKTTLTGEYLAAFEHGGIDLQELEEIALNAVRASLLPDDDKQTMLQQFSETYAQLRAEHVTAEAT